MNVLKHDLGNDIHKLHIYPIGDLHIGSGHTELKELKALLNIIEQDANGFVILNGDLINNALKNSVSDVYEERLNPERQIEMLVELFKPIAHKILSVTTGNHETRTWKIAGIDILKNFCYRLGIEDLYNPVSNVVFVSFGKSRDREHIRNTFNIYHTHGRGGGSTVGAKANRLHKLSQIITANLYTHSHTHTPMIYKEDYYLTNNSNKGVSKASRLFVNTNAYEGFGGYGEVLGLRPSNNEYVVIKVWANKKGKVCYQATL